MKIRTDFVSNSSSSSFIVNREQHGGYFFQLFSMLRSIKNDAFSHISVSFNESVTPSDLSFGFDLVDKFYSGDMINSDSVIYWNVSRYNDNGNLTCAVTTNSVNILCKLPPKLIDQITEVRGSFHDYHDVGGADSNLLKKLKSTGFKFDWWC